MRRLIFVACAVFAAMSFVSLATLSAQAQSVDQYGSSDGTEAPRPPEPTVTDTAPQPTPSGAGFVSQGSVTEADSKEAFAARKDLAEEGRLPSYTRVVDNTTRTRFQARGWKVRRGSDWSHGKSYVSAGAGAKSARFEVKIPSSNDYSVYAWWPKSAGNNTKARFGVGTADGTKWSEINQRAEGGMWVKVGTYPMRKGQRVVQVAPKSSGEGKVVADAVAVVRGEAVSPPGDQPSSSGAATKGAPTGTRAAKGSGYAVVRQARAHLGDSYKYATCTTTVKSCTCLTRMAVAPFGHNMPMTERGQWTYEQSVKIPYSKLQPGDEVFFKENGRSGPITHVGIYSGNGMIIHASSYFGKVVEKQMKYVTGFAGAKRFKFS